MPDLKQSPFHESVLTEHKGSCANASTRTVASVLFILGVMSSSLGIATAQQESSGLQSRRADLEIQKLEVEVAKLKEDRGGLPTWLTAFLGGVVATATTVWATRRARLGALDQSVHDKRLESYPDLVKATWPLALYFPGGDPPILLGPKECGAMGQALSKWYFDGGGLLLSVKARDAYFRLARALTCASLAEALRVPMFPKDARDISKEKVDEYRAELAQQFNLDDVEDWNFGGPESESDAPSRRFKDYVFLQWLSSTLRTTLSKDLRSRRRPS